MIRIAPEKPEDAVPTFLRIAPSLWIDRQAEEAANFCVSSFKNSRVVEKKHDGKAGREVHPMPAGTGDERAFRARRPDVQQNPMDAQRATSAMLETTMLDIAAL
ncbi:MAG: VOC family protein, partial [Betaproteobacteria bacterium]